MFSASATPAVFPGAWPPLCQAGTGMSQSCDRTLSGKFVQPYVSICDKYCLGGEMWGSESADAGGQGRIWASAYPDILLARNELGGFTTHMVPSPTICGQVRTGIPVHCDDWDWKTAGTGA